MMICKKLILIAFALISINIAAQVQTPENLIREALIEVDIDPQIIHKQVVELRNTTIDLPFGSIGYSSFRLEEDDMMAEDFVKARPDLKIYKIFAEQNESVKGRLLVTPLETYATIHTSSGLTSIYPQDNIYVIENGIQLNDDNHSNCGHSELTSRESEMSVLMNQIDDNRISFSNGTTLRRYKLAVACTGEFYMLNGNSDAQAQNVIASVVMGLNVIYENELAVQFDLLTPFLYKNKNTDPFDPTSSLNRPDQASVGVNMAFNTNTYDIGHVFHQTESGDGWDGGGVARLYAVCDDFVSNGGPTKAKGWSGSFNVTSNGFIYLTSHEFAHMFGANHTFNGTGGSCTDNISAATAYEIGSGTSIMSYNGTCESGQNIPVNAADGEYFHAHSISEMLTFINTSATCADQIPINNTPPIVNANPCGGSIMIPKSTPFFLDGSASDQQDEALTYSWEQYDEDGANTPTQGFIGSDASNSLIAPLFRSMPLSERDFRYFPDLETLAEGATSDPFQALPAKGRDLHFQLTARDNNPLGGGISSADIEVQVQSSGPLSVQNVNAMTAGVPLTFSWSTNGSDDLCAEAKVLLSIDGGATYPFTVASGIDYASGSTQVTLSESFPGTDQGRLMLVCDDNECYSFFDISNNDITISSSCAAGSSYLCDDNYEVFDQGDATLSLDLNHFNGNEISSIETTITSSNTDNIIKRLTNDTDGVSCFETNLNTFSESMNFTVNESGLYSFFIDFGVGEGTKYVSIHTASNYSKTNQCLSFLESNATFNGSSFDISSLLAAELDACEEYVMTFIVNTPNFPVDLSIPSISGPGAIVRIDTEPSDDYSSTFIAVDENGIIEVVSPTSDFTALAGGLYDIYTVNYKSGGTTPPAIADPSTWVGQSLTSVQSINCVLLSANKKTILVEFNCRINDITLGSQTMCDPISNTYSQEVTITYESPPLTGNLIVNGVPNPIISSPQTFILTGLIADGQNLGVSASFSEIPSCSVFVPVLIAAPENCCEIEFDLGEDRAVCDQEITILDAGSDGVEYKWFKDGTPLTDETGQTYQVLTTGNYIVEVINDVGCSKTEIVNISVFPSPTMELGEDLSVCEGEIHIIQSNSTAPNLQWFKDGTSLPGEDDLTLLITEAGQYHLDGFNEFAFGAGVVSCSISDTVNIEYTTRPVVDLGIDQEFCGGDPAYVLNAGQEGTEYSWARNGVVIAGEATDMLEVTTTGQYTVIVDKGGGCDAKDTINVEFFELAEIFAGEDLNFCSGNTGELGTFINATSYEWYLNGSLIADQSETPEVSEGGEYVLVALNEIGCESMDTVVVTEVTPPDIDLGEDKVGCIGSDVNLSVDSVGNVFWSIAGSFISSNANITVTESGEYVVRVIAASDCSDLDTVNVSFVPGPTLELGMNGSFCEGGNFTINADTDGDNIKWFLGEVEIVGETGFDLEVTEAGNYSALVSGASGCVVEDEIIISVNPLPDLDLGDDEVICDGESVTLTTDLPADSYTWTLDGSTVSDQPEFSTDIAGEYTLTVVNQFGCTDSDMIIVSANAVPSVSLESSYAICEGENATILAEGNGDTFQWFINGEELLGESGNTISVDIDATVEVIASSEAGCTSEAATTVSSASSPTVDLGEDLSICPNDVIVLNGGDHAIYLWSDESTNPTLTVNSFFPEEIIVQTYGVTVTNTDGCSDQDEIDVTFFPEVTAVVEQSATGVCNGEPVQLTASGGTEYTWIDDSGTLTNIDGPNAQASPSETTTYQVIVGDECPGNEDQQIITIEVFEAGEEISAGEDDCAVNGKSVTLNAVGGVSYSWRTDPTIDSGSDTANPTVSPTEETTYFVDITDINGCVFTDSVFICILDDPLEFFELVSIITPNGDGDNDALEFTGLEAFPENTLTIYNRWGYAVFEKKGYQQTGDLWNGENGGDVLPADTYYYILTFDDQVFKSSITILR